MKISITEETVKKDFPDIYKKFQERKEKSKAKGSFIPFDKFEFSFEIAERIQCHTLGDIFSGKALKDQKKEINLTIDEQLQKRLKNLSVWISASCGQYCLGSDTLKEIPEQVKDQYRKSIQEQEDERKRVEALTPEERNEETQRLLKELRKDPDFFEMHIPMDDQ